MAALTMLAFSMPVAALAETKLPIPLPLKKAEPELKKDLAHLIPYSTQLAERYTDLQGRVAELFQPAEVHEKLVELSEKLEDLGWEIRFLKSAGGQSYSKVPALHAQVSRYDAKIKEIRKPVSKALQELAAWKNEWTR
jgi:uncharacterized coiled-coil DUF342 family protein